MKLKSRVCHCCHNLITIHWSTIFFLFLFDIENNESDQDNSVCLLKYYQPTVFSHVICFMGLQCLCWMNPIRNQCITLEEIYYLSNKKKKQEEEIIAWHNLLLYVDVTSLMYHLSSLFMLTYHNGISENYFEKNVKNNSRKFRFKSICSFNLKLHLDS